MLQTQRALTEMTRITVTQTDLNCMYFSEKLYNPSLGSFDQVIELQNSPNVMTDYETLLQIHLKEIVKSYFMGSHISS